MSAAARKTAALASKKACNGEHQPAENRLRRGCRGDPAAYRVQNATAVAASAGRYRGFPDRLKLVAQLVE